MESSLSVKIKPRSLVDVVAERLESAIVDGSLAPGSRLSEQALAASLGVSRGPLREAIRRLEGRRLLERTPNIGVRVAELSLKDLHEVLQVREALEGMACGLAALNMTAEEFDGLDRLLDEHAHQKDLKVGAGYYQEAKDYDFHFRIVKGSGNARLIGMLCEDLYDVLRVYRYKSSTADQRSTKALQEHRDIVSTMRKRDFELAEAAMRHHIQTARLHVEALLRANPQSKGTTPQTAPA